MNNFLKIFFLFIIFIFCFCKLSRAQGWIRQLSPTIQNLDHCFFINNNIGWIAGDSGTIIKTSDGGKNWIKQNSGVVNKITSLFFINERLGWAASWNIIPDSMYYFGSIILKTTNGGMNWVRSMYQDTGKFLTTIYFLDSLRGFVAGTPIIIALTTNGGMSWNNVDTDTTLEIGYPIYNLKFFNSQIGYASGGFRDLAGAMWRTTNGGLNWKATIVSPEPLTDLYIFSPNKTIAVGGDFEYGSSYVKTTDFGLNWFYDTLGIFGIARSIDFRTSYEGWIAVGIAQKFVYTLDTGNTWSSIYAPDSVSINDIDFIDSLQGWAVGDDGALLKYNATMVINNEAIELYSPISFILYQNYPNPFNPNTIITYTIGAGKLRSSNYVSLKIFNVLGKEISTLVQEKQSPGKYSISFDGSSLPSGIYFYELKVENFSQVRKMLLLR